MWTSNDKIQSVISLGKMKDPTSQDVLTFFLNFNHSSLYFTLRQSPDFKKGNIKLVKHPFNVRTNLLQTQLLISSDPP